MAKIFTKIDGPVVVNTIIGKVSLDTIANFVSNEIDTWIEKAELWDLTQMDFSDITSEKLRGFMQSGEIITAAKKRTGGKTAIAAPDDIQYGMMRALEILSEVYSFQTNIRVFRTMEQAKLWLSGSLDKITSHGSMNNLKTEKCLVD